MGHVRLGKLPRTRKWREVVDLLAAGVGPAQVADATLRTAEEACSYKTASQGGTGAASLPSPAWP